MKCFKEWPVVLQRRWVLTWAVGAAFLLVGLAACFAFHDKNMLILSLLLAFFTSLHCIDFYYIVRHGEYEEIDGVCSSVRRAGMGKRRYIRLLLSDGTEREIVLDKRTTVRTGNRYRMYFRRSSNTLHFSELSKLCLTDTGFLGFEDLGEFSAD